MAKQSNKQTIILQLEFVFVTQTWYEHYGSLKLIQPFSKSYSPRDPQLTICSIINSVQNVINMVLNLYLEAIWKWSIEQWGYKLLGSNLRCQIVEIIPLKSICVFLLCKIWFNILFPAIIIKRLLSKSKNLLWSFSTTPFLVCFQLSFF